jgi:hypothetical protein
VVPRQVRAPQHLAALDEQDPPTGLGEHARSHAAAGARADHDHVVGVGHVVDPDRRRRHIRRGRPARPRLHVPVAELRPGARVPVVRPGRDAQHARQGDPGRRVGIGQQLADERLPLGPAPGGEGAARPARLGGASDRRQRGGQRPVVLQPHTGHEGVGDRTQEARRLTALRAVVLAPGHGAPCSRTRRESSLVP